MYCTTQSARKGVCGHATPIAALAAAVAALALAFAALVAPASAWADPAASGDCSAAGDGSVTWAIVQNNDDAANPTYTLTISGAGAMADYKSNIVNGAATQPWRQSETGIDPKLVNRVVVEQGVTNIGAFAFNGMGPSASDASVDNAMSYSIADSVASIGNWAVQSGNVATWDGAVTENNRAVKVVDGVLYSKDGMKLIDYPGAANSRDSFAVADGVTEVLPGSFNGCDAKSVVLPDGVKTLGSWLFSAATTESVSMPAGIESIGGGAFSGVASLRNFEFRGVANGLVVGSSAFSKTGASEITLPAGIASIADGAFKQSAALEKVVFTGKSDGMTIGEQAFLGCPNLVEVDLPEGISSLGNQCFQNSAKLEKVIFGGPSKDLTIGEISFTGTALKTIELPSGLKEVCDNAFAKLSSLTSVTFAGAASSEGLVVGPYSFQQTAIGSIALPDGVKSIGKYAFHGCNSLGSIDLGTPCAGAEICDRAFGGAVIQSLVIPEGYTTIHSWALSELPSIGYIKLPSTVTRVEQNATHALTNNGNKFVFDATAITSASIFHVTDGVYDWYSASSGGVPSVCYIANADVAAAMSGKTSSGADVLPGFVCVTNGGALTGSASADSFAAVAKDGYIFGGWYESADFSGDAVSAPVAGKTYYAKWTKKADSDTKPAAGDQAAQGTQDNPVEATYGDTAVNFTVKIAARADSGVSTQAAQNEEAVPEGKVGFFYNGVKVGDFVDYDAATGTATLAYNTTTKVIPAGDVQELTVKFGGSDTLMPSEGAFYAKIAKANQNLQFAEAEKTQHVGIVSNVLSGFESGAGVNYSSGNTDVATVGSDGTVVIVAPGRTTITARSLGNDWYNDASATYELIVTEHDFRTFAGDERGHWQKCAIDGCEATTAISAHSFGAWQVTPASATVDGKRVHSCDTCGYREEQVIPKDDAPLFESPAVSVHISAAADGVDGPQLQNTAEGDAVTYTVSSIDATQPVAIVDLRTGRIHPQIPGRAKVTAAITRGDNRFVATYELTVTDHEFDEGKMTTPATCTTPGVKTFTCKYEGCTEARTEPVDALGHEWADYYTVDTAATCTADGAKSIHCMRCDEVKPGSEQVVPANGHELAYKHDVRDHWQECAKCDYATSHEAHHFGEWEVTKKATATADGERQRACDVCGYAVVEKLAATGEPGVKPGSGDNGNGAANGAADAAAPVADEQVALAATGDNAVIAAGVAAAMGAIALAVAAYVARRRANN